MGFQIEIFSKNQWLSNRMRIAMSKPSNAISKGVVLIGQLTNWPLLIKDKLIGGDNILYKFRSGEVIECRTKSTDINEAVVVLSGIEYPEPFCKLNDSQPIIFDIGANIGSFSVYAHRLNKHLNPIIYAFEPHPDNAQITKANLKRNGLSGYHIVQKALAGIDGAASFDTSGAFDSFKLKNKDTANSIEVETVKLSSFCQAKGIDRINLLKIDIEGGEYDVIEHDLDFVNRCVDVILVEYHNFNVENGDLILIKALEKNFSIHIQNPHADGGMLIAVNKVLSDQ